MELGSAGRNKIPLSLQDKNCFLHRNRTVSRRDICLAVKLGVNPNTIQKAYQILESSSVIYSVKGKGSFISDDAAADTAVIKAAKRDFRAAVTAANELGLKSEELHGIVNEVCKEAENND